MIKINVPIRMIMYDMMFAMGDTLIKVYNPCKISVHPTEGVVCYRGHPCCGGCEHLDSNGCMVKCLRCKLYLCFWYENSRLMQNLYMIKTVAGGLDLLSMRTSRDYIRKRLIEYKKYCESGVRLTLYGNLQREG
jgi:hypothetical protein